MGLSVLVCDDSNMARKQVLRSLPESLSENVQTATNGAEALDVLSSANIDVLFLDLTMPVLDGLGVLQGIQDKGIDVSVFVISAVKLPRTQFLGNPLKVIWPYLSRGTNKHLKIII